MSLQTTVEKDFLTAYKAKEDVKVAVLRMLKTAIKNAMVELRRDLNDDEVLDLIAKQVKQRKESIEQFTKGGRPELAAQEQLEMDALQAYLPTQLSDEELEIAIDAIIVEMGVSDIKEMGRVMQALLAKHKGQVDGKKASTLVRDRLAQ